MAKRILVIDRDCLTCDNLKVLLEGEGYIVATARDWSSGLASAYREEADLVLLDICVPDGHSLAQARRLREELAVPFIFSMERAEEADIVRGQSLGAEEYITKPYNVPELLEHINRAFWQAGRDLPPN